MAKERPSDLWADLASYEDGKNGGSRRATMPARIGPLHRRGRQLLQTFILVSATLSGVNAKEQVKATRIDLTPKQIQQMLEGERKIPAGLPEKLLRQSLETLTQREERLEKNQARMDQSYARKHA